MTRAIRDAPLSRRRSNPAMPRAPLRRWAFISTDFSSDIPNIRRRNPDYFADDARAREPLVNGRKARPRRKKAAREESHVEF